jgi:hypothetical protein
VPDVVELIERDHRELEEQLAKLAATLDVAVVAQLGTDVERHLRAEECVLYPVVARELPNGALMAGESEDDHAEMRSLVTALRAEADPDRLAGLVEQLRLSLELHVDTEETEVLPQVRAVLEPDCVDALGRAYLIARGSSHAPASEV